MPQNLERALAARRESRRVAFRPHFDGDVLKDIVAMANSGGGIILFGVDQGGNPTGADLSTITSANIAEQLRQNIDVQLDDLDLAEFRKFSQPVLALTVGPAPTPVVFGNSGVVYFRHGAKSEPGTSADLASAIDRQLRSVRRSWLTAVRRVVHEQAPEPATEPVAIRVVEDRRAPAYRVVDYDRTHPYRQKELLAELRNRGFGINQFDLRAVRNVHSTDANADFSHKPVFGSRQYSEKFLRWLEDQVARNPRFFAEAREVFQKK